MAKRQKLEQEQITAIETTALEQINERYQKAFINIEDAATFFKQLSGVKKRRFTDVWAMIDRAVGKGDLLKSYSYKHITETVIERSMKEKGKKWDEGTLIEAKKYILTLILQKRDDILKAQTDKEARQACKEVKALTFTQFNDFQNERVQGTRKTMMDMLGHVIDSQVKAIRAGNQTQQQATPNGSQKEFPTQQEVSLYNFDSFMQY
ncbi:Hypothetical_protein [Hexamita inflata]|uniref:Hypothetical_protein n=1 Tax=Hexamita inflata TaxID=28002 RepID=A0ABP1I7B2_9EUKA